MPTRDGRVVLYRIATDTPDYDAADLTGQGARLSGGRWNRPGTAMVYVSTSRALACLETVVHLAGSEPLPLNRYLVELIVPSEVWAARTVFDPSAHVGWDALPAGHVSMDWGTDWVQRQDAVLADVPSVAVPEEQNVLVNATHPDAGQLRAVKVRRWLYDGRLDSR